MSVDPTTPIYGSNNPDHYKAVVDVNVNAANPNDPTALGSKAKAEVVIIGGTLDGTGTIVPVAGSTNRILDAQYVATATATGYNTGDIIENVLELDTSTSPATIVHSTWVNATQSTVLASAPPSTDIAQMAGGVTVSNFPTNIDTAALINLTAQAAGTVNSADQTNSNGKGVQVGINLTTVTTATVTINIQGKDTASGQYYTILSSTALAAAGFTNMTVYPGAATTANVSSPQPLPKTWRVQAVIVGASAAVTGTVGASVIE